MARTRKRRMMNQINVVPYIDVMLVLLVIFMVTAPMTNPGVVNLPKVGQALSQPDPRQNKPLVISVKKDGSIEVAGKNMSRDVLLLTIKNTMKQSSRAVVVAADEKTQYGEVIKVMDLLKQAKVEKVGLLFNPKQP